VPANPRHTTFNSAAPATTMRTHHFPILALLLLPGPAPAADLLDRIDVLVRAGAPQLALHALNEAQPEPASLDEWMRWERRRLAIHEALGEWEAIAERVENVPQGLPLEQRRELWVAAAVAQIRAGDGEAARRFLRRLLWGHDGAALETAPWRRLVIQSYLADDEVDDARIAMERYDGDFHPVDPQWAELHARIALRAGEYADAAQLTATSQTHEGRLLQLLATVRRGGVPQDQLLARIRDFEKDTRKRSEINRRAWALLADAALTFEDPLLRVQALERAIPVDDRLLRVDARDLWRAYSALGELLGNRARLLVGEDGPWFELAATHEKEGKRSAARAVFALIAGLSRDTLSREQAHMRLLDSLNEDGLERVAVLVYTPGEGRFDTYAELPPAVRYRLSEAALKGYDVKRAAQIVDGLENPPKDVDGITWRLRRARLAIYAGDFDAGVGLLQSVVDDTGPLDDARADEILQVVFDLQAVDRHAQAVGLFSAVHDLAQTTRMQRETLFWMGESRSALGQHERAAQHYLGSALYGGADGWDLWGQSARYHAAEALGEAGLTADARRLYEALLQTTQDPNRRVVIERNIQQLWLKQNKPSTP
jgi:tetratricopeptide (TPR) repeat protein